MKTIAKKTLMQRIMTVLAGYFLTFSGTFWYVRHHHPRGAALYVCATLPWAAMCGVIVSIALYFHEERDGYSRDLAMRIMLCGAGAAMAANFFLVFLRMFGWRGQAPPFLDLYVFTGAAGIARIAYAVTNRPECGPKESER